MAAPSPVESPASVIELCGVAVESADGGEKPALRGVNWRVGAGDFWVVGGLAGSGKTALLETAAGLRAPAAGTVRLWGEDNAALSGQAQLATRRKLGFVYGDGGRLLSHLTVAQNLALPLCYHHNRAGEAVAAEVEARLESFGLAAVAHRLPGQVNPAFQQRAALARAMMLNPEVLLLDNPFAALNTGHMRWWLDYLTRPAHAAPAPGSPPATVVVACDDLRPWLAVARQFALIQEGVWQALGGREALGSAGGPGLRELLAEPAANR